MSSKGMERTDPCEPKANGGANRWSIQAEVETMQNKETQHTYICMREVDVEASNHPKTSDRKQWTWMTQTTANLTEGRPIPMETSKKKGSGPMI